LFESTTRSKCDNFSKWHKEKWYLLKGTLLGRACLNRELTLRYCLTASRALVEVFFFQSQPLGFH
jgi:hypothetical protein